MAKINPGTLKDFTDGEYLKANDLDQVLEIIRTAVNDNYDGLVARYTKTDIDTLLFNLNAGIATNLDVVEVLPTGTIQGKLVLKSPENTIQYYTGTDWIIVAKSSDVTAAISALTTTITTHTNNISNPHGVTAAQISAVPTSAKGVANGVATLDGGTKIPTSQLPVINIPIQNVIYSVGTNNDNAAIAYISNMVSTLSTSMTKLREAKINIKGTVRVVFSLYAGSSSNWVEARVYVNGSPVGVLRSHDKSSPGLDSQDDITVNPGDLIQIYARSVSGSTSSQVTGFGVYKAMEGYITL